MNLLDNLQILLRPLRTRINTVVARAVVKAVEDSKKFQQLQVEILDGETREDVEHFQSYGFRANPPLDSEAVVVCPGGRRDHAIAIAVNSRAYRIGNLESGEVLVYDKTGSKILLKANGDIEVTPSSGKFSFTGDVAVSGKLDVTGNITGSADVKGEKVLDGSIELGTHTHAGSSLSGSSACTSGGSTVTISGNTAAPS